MSDPQLTELFDRVASTYEENSMDVPASASRRLLALSSAGPFPTPITTSSVIHDNASGPGVLTTELLKLSEFASASDAAGVPKIHCTDIHPAMIRVLEAKGLGEKYGVEGTVMDSQALQFPDNMFTHSFTNLSIFALPDPVKGAKEIYRTLKPGGIALVDSLKRTGWLVPFQNAAKRVRPQEETWKGLLPEWEAPGHLQKIMEAGGFTSDQVQVETFAAPFKMKNFVQKQPEIIAMASKTLTQEYSAEEVKRFNEALKEELEAESERNTTVEMVLWIAIAKK